MLITYSTRPRLNFVPKMTVLRNYLRARLNSMSMVQFLKSRPVLYEPLGTHIAFADDTTTLCNAKGPYDDPGNFFGCDLCVACYFKLLKKISWHWNPPLPYMLVIEPKKEPYAHVCKGKPSSEHARLSYEYEEVMCDRRLVGHKPRGRSDEPVCKDCIFKFFWDLGVTPPIAFPR